MCDKIDVKHFLTNKCNAIRDFFRLVGWLVIEKTTLLSIVVKSIAQFCRHYTSQVCISRNSVRPQP